MNPRLLRLLCHHVVPEPEPHPVLGTPCWRFTGGRTNRNGYTRVAIAGREPVAHRWLYETLIGPIPADHLLDHLCRNRWCVNVFNHTEPVTHAENTRRGEAVLFGDLT